MAMQIAHNISAINTQRNLGKANTGLGKSIEKLSSGYRINVGADGPADLLISEQLRAQTAGLNRALKNTNEANNFLSIAEGALNEMNSILTKMKSLAIHSAQSGITSPDQVAANQSELNSAIESIGRIANTTKYSDTFLLNGSQEIKFKTTLQGANSASNNLIDQDATQINQVSRLSSRLSISFSGVNDAGNASEVNVAKKAFLEGDSTVSGTSIKTAGNASQGQYTSLGEASSFILSGNLGSQKFAFNEGDSLGSVVAAIQEKSDLTGVSATLVFATAVTGKTTTAATAAGTAAGKNAATGEAIAWHMDKNFEAKTTGANINVKALGTGAVVGKNTNADGNVFLKVTNATGAVATTKAEIYADAEMTKLVGYINGLDGTITSTEANNSGLSGLAVSVLAADIGNVAAGDVIMANIAGSQLEVANATAAGAVTDVASGFWTGVADTGVAGAGSMLNGVRLGENTDENGKIYMRTEVGTGGNAAGEVTVKLYSSADMDEKSLVAQGTNTAALAAGSMNIQVFAETKNGGNLSTGIYGSINLSEATAGGVAGYTAGTVVDSVLNASALGVRVSANEYGSSNKVEIEQLQGTLFNDTGGKAIDKGRTVTTYGQNASVTVNGNKVNVTEDFKVVLADFDISAEIAIDKGELGKTTLANMGYTDGAFASRIGQMTTLNNFATQCLNTTTETVTEMKGGVQLHLGESDSPHERTVLSIRDMNTNTLGRTEFTGDFGTGITETRYATLDDLKDGGFADLATDPLKALAVIEQAIQDVAGTRARIGAVQANMLATTANNLEVAIENITKTESAIRDTDMASEMTEFTKNQVLQSASISMTAQANQQSQMVLQLLG